MPNEFSPPVPCSVAEKLFLFEDQNAAENWLQKAKLNIASTPLLIPFKKGSYVEFLKLSDKEDRLRIIGAANYLVKKKITEF